MYSGKFSQMAFPGARDSSDQGGLEHEAGRVGRPLQDRPGGQGQEGRQVLCSCGEFLFEKKFVKRKESDNQSKTGFEIWIFQVRDWGSQGAANDVLQDYLKANK